MVQAVGCRSLYTCHDNDATDRIKASTARMVVIQ
nr:MAG TPA: hypothetical protein [Caudoviricetes sp.]